MKLRSFTAFRSEQRDRLRRPHLGGGCQGLVEEQVAEPPEHVQVVAFKVEVLVIEAEEEEAEVGREIPPSLATIDLRESREHISFGNCGHTLRLYPEAELGALQNVST